MASGKDGVVTEKVYVDGNDGKIPVLISRKNDTKPRPAIIFLSGAPGTLRTCTKFVEGLPAKGFVGVTYEPRTRGERPISHYTNAPDRLVYREIDCPHAGPKIKPLIEEAFAFLEKHLKQ